MSHGEQRSVKAGFGGGGVVAARWNKPSDAAITSNPRRYPGHDVQTPRAPYGLTPRDGHAPGRRPGLTNTEIGRRLFISESTVSVHVTNILRKLALNNREVRA